MMIEYSCNIISEVFCLLLGFFDFFLSSRTRLLARLLYLPISYSLLCVILDHS